MSDRATTLAVDDGFESRALQESEKLYRSLFEGEDPRRPEPIAKNEYEYVADGTTEFGELPPVLCHVGDLNQVFLNLIVNAAHAIGDVVGPGGGKGTIRIRTSREGDMGRIDIADTGSGIPESIRHRVFDPFFTTKEVGKGTGQGLPIARNIVVTKHRGSLTFETEVGKGTTFMIRLPIDGDGVA